MSGQISVITNKAPDDGDLAQLGRSSGDVRSTPPTSPKPTAIHAISKLTVHIAKHPVVILSSNLRSWPSFRLPGLKLPMHPGHQSIPPICQPSRPAAELRDAATTSRSSWFPDLPSRPAETVPVGSVDCSSSRWRSRSRR